MDRPPLIVRQEVPDYYTYALIPFRTVTLLTAAPVWPSVNRIETDEVRWTCPDGWHESPTFYAMPTQEQP